MHIPLSVVNVPPRLFVAPEPGALSVPCAPLDGTVFPTPGHLHARGAIPLIQDIFLITSADALEDSFSPFPPEVASYNPSARSRSSLSSR